MIEVKSAAEAEKDAILVACSKFKTGLEIAKALGFSRPTLYRRLRKYGISRFKMPPPTESCE